ncbi:MAG: hypothetical protein AB7U81_00585 [Thiohalomonadaceae bacterium]
MEGKDFIPSRRDTRRLVEGLLLLEAVLVLLYLVERALGSPFWFFQRLLDLNGELSVAAWFSSMQLFAVGLVLLLKAWRPGGLAPVGRWLLYVAGFAFVFLSADEALAIHESITNGLARFEWSPHFKNGHGRWIPVYLAAVVAFAIVSLPRLLFVWRNFRAPFLLCLGGFVVFVAGAVGAEVIGYDMIGAASPLALTVEVACEEWMEMAGITLVLAGALGLLREDREPVFASVAERLRALP